MNSSSRPIKHAALLILLLVSACSKPTEAPAASGCGSDKDCKGDRVCEKGVCVSTAPALEKPVGEAGAPAVVEVPPVPPPVAAKVESAPVAPAETPAPVVSREMALATAPSLGAAEPLVLVSMFADLQCPYSARATTVVRALLEKYGKPGGVLRFEYRHDPLDAHPRAEVLARSAVAAHLQGRFWLFHDKILSNGGKVGEGDVLEVAKAIGLDLVGFQNDRSTGAVGDRIRRDRRVAVALGVTGTPTFFVNGRKFPGVQTLADIESAVEDEIAKAKSSGKPPAEAMTDRIRTNNPDFAKYLLDGTQPPEEVRPAMPVDTTIWKVPVSAEDAAVGPSDALVTLVEFADFECPFSAKLAPTLKQLRDKYPDTVRLVFKHSPLAIHPAARASATVAIQAQEKGKFWEFHDKAYERGGMASESTVIGVAVELGLDEDLLRKAVAEGAGKDRIEADLALAARVDAIGTPNLYVNGRRVVGARAFEELDALVQEALTSAKALVAGGTATATNVYEKTIESGTQKQALATSRLDFVVDGAPALGEATAPATLVLFSDFQCPFSSRLLPILDRTMQRFPNQIRVIFKHFPQEFHPDAVPAARMAICAQEQGKFWELLRSFFDIESQKSLTEEFRQKYAKAAGLDMAALKECLASKRPEGVLERDADEAKLAEIKGTPTLFINGRRFTSPTGYNDRSLGGVLSQILGQKPQ